VKSSLKPFPKDEKDMPILSAVASLLESAAAGLRRAGEVSTKTAVEAPAGAVVQRIAPEQRPIGYWRCVSSKFDDFKPGHAYLCIRTEGTGCIRIPPYEGSVWSPYWQPHNGTFCYPRSDLDFVYLGTTLPEGEMRDLRTRDDRVAARLEANLARRAA
jgi:hypothetical protein